MKISIRLKPQQVATAAGAYSAPDMGAAEQLQYSDEELAERDAEEKARQEVAEAEERKKAAEKQKKDAAKAPQTPKEAGESGTDGDDKSGDDSEEEEEEDDESEEDESDDESEEEEDDGDEEEEEEDEGDEEATAASKLPYPEAQSNRKASDLIPAETIEQVVDPEVQKELDEKKETEAAQARPLSKEDPNNKDSQGKKMDKENGNTLVATASSSGLPYPDVKLRNR